MSRPISITSAVTFNPNGTTGSSNIGTSTNYPLSNGYHGISNTSSYARLQLSANNTSTTCYIYYTFNVNGIPSNATINSVSCTARIYRNSRVTQNTSAIQLYNGTTAKGAATTGFTTAASNIQIANTGSWTVSELSNIRLRISGARSNTNNSSYIYFYGADLTINYTVSGVEYEVTATSEYDGASVSPSSQFIFQGEDAVVRIDTDTLDNMVLEDNGTDVTENLQYVAPQGGNFTFTGHPTSFDPINTNVEVNNTSGSGLTIATSSSRAYFLSNEDAYSESNIYYNFDCSSIPEDANIESVTCETRAVASSARFDTRIVQLCAGTTKKGSPTQIRNSSINDGTIYTLSIDGGNSWTRNELNNLKILIQAIRGSDTNTFNISFYGASLTIQYSVPTTPYYKYTISNITADHDIVFKQAVIVPPEEDPKKEYYSLTISSINATTEPGRGTIRVESGTNETIKIYPTDPQLTITTDNGANISNQLVYHAGSQPTYSVSTAQGADYGFTLNNGTGYYTSQNKGVNKSAAVSKIDFDLPVSCLVTFQFINYAEAAYDFGVFGNIDATLSNDYYAAGSNGATITDSNYKLACNNSTYNTSSVQTLTYEIPEGQHYIYVKYSKDDASEDNNDSLQWKISNIEQLSPMGDAYYEYTLSDINQNHSLIFIFGDVTYYYITSIQDGNGRLYPDGQTVCLPGDTYKLTIVPENPEDAVTASDNNSDVTNSLERKEVITEKNRQTALTVNYIYTILNVQSAHTISVHYSNVTRYDINASSTYTGATVRPLTQSAREGYSATIDIDVNNLYEIKVKDNGVDVTSNLAEEDNGCSYTIDNVQSAHTITVEEAPNVTITASSTYTNATATPATQKVYTTQNGVVTISTTNYAAIDVKDNGTDVKSSLVSAGGNNYTYTLTRPTANHTIVVSQKQYTATASSSYANATITPASQTVLHGDSATITISGDIIPIKVLDNGTDITASLVKNGNTLTYTLTNVQTGHTIALSFVQTGFVKTSSGYAAAKKYYRKTAATTWTEITMAEFQTYKNNNTIFYN